MVRSTDSEGGVRMVKSDTVKAARNALRILEHLSAGGSAGVSELARALGAQKSAVFRLLATLKESGYVDREEGGEKYRLTLKLFKLGSSAVQDLDLNRAAVPVITRLAQLTSETVHLCVIESGQIVYLHKIESTYSLKVSMMSRVGQGTPFYCTGVGKVLMAWQDAGTIGGYLREGDFRRFTEHTITEPLALASELQRVRAAGYAYDDEEHEAGVRCVAAPVFDAQGRVAAAVSVSGPSVRLTDNRMEGLRALVVGSAGEISAKLGFASDGASGGSGVSGT